MRWSLLRKLSIQKSNDKHDKSRIVLEMFVDSGNSPDAADTETEIAPKTPRQRSEHVNEATKIFVVSFYPNIFSATKNE